MRETTISDCKIIDLPRIYNPAGSITSINEKVNIPFEIKRVYYLYDLPAAEKRGGHAHRQLTQLLVAVSGSFDVLLDDSVNSTCLSLNRPFKGLLIRPGIWRELLNFSACSVCLVLASDLYKSEDYIRDKRDFQTYKTNGGR